MDGYLKETENGEFLGLGFLEKTNFLVFSRRTSTLRDTGSGSEDGSTMRRNSREIFNFEEKFSNLNEKFLEFAKL